MTGIMPDSDEGSGKGRGRDALETSLVTSRDTLARARARVSDASGPDAKLEAAADAAIEVMTDALAYGEPREQAEAARVLLAARAHSKPKEGPPVPTAEEQRERMRAMLANPPAEFAEMLSEAGYERKP